MAARFSRSDPAVDSHSAAGSRDASPVPGSGARASLHTYRLGRAFSLGKRKQYAYVYKRGRSVSGRYLTLVFLRARDLKVGFSVSSKVGNSVTRNLLRRYMKEDFRMLRPALKCGKYIFVARVQASGAGHRALAAEMNYLLHKADLFRPAQEGGGR